MKIAFLTPEFPHPKTGISGGIGTSILNLSDALIKHGHHVLILIYGQDKEEVFTENGIAVHRIKNIKVKGLSWYLTQKKIQRHINELAAAREIDLVEAPDWTGITSNIRARCPVVVRLHGSDTYFCHLDNRPVKKITKISERKALQNADGLLSVSQYTADVTNRLMDLNRKFTVIHNGIDPKKFDVPAHHSTQEKQTILYFGTLIRKKGLLELPAIFNAVHAKNNDAELVLVGRDAGDVKSGNSSTWEMMVPLFTSVAFKKVKYLGSVGYSDIISHISSAAVCVFPTFAEALPVSWLESMAMKKAIVASDIGWAKEIISDGIDGFLTDPKNHEQFAEKILALLENPDLRRKIGENARQTITERFDISIIAKKNIDFYKSVTKR